MVWKRMISFPIRCKSAGQSFLNCSVLFLKKNRLPYMKYHWKPVDRLKNRSSSRHRLQNLDTHILNCRRQRSMTADAEISGKQQAISHLRIFLVRRMTWSALSMQCTKKISVWLQIGMLHLWEIFHQGLRGLTERTFMRAVHSAWHRMQMWRYPHSNMESHR